MVLYLFIATTSSPAPQTKAPDEDFDAGAELVLRPLDVRRVVPDRILSVRILPLVYRTVLAAGNKLGHVGFWDVDGVVVDEDGDGADGVFEYMPHRGRVGAIVAHPATPQKVGVGVETGTAWERRAMGGAQRGGLRAVLRG
ncbi:hypothetical protein ABZP36_010318 [Zizania latifolia]